MSDILIYTNIGGGGITAQAIFEAVKSTTPGDLVTVRINSNGGDVFEGLSIYNALREVKPHVYVDGLAASMASVVAMAGAKVFMAENALMMIHKPWTSSTGNADDLREHAALLDKAGAQLVKAYASKTGLPESQIMEMLSKETWLDAAEALELGFVDEIVQPSQLAASLDLSMFASVPEKISAAITANKDRANQINTMVSMFSDKLSAEFVTGLIADPQMSVEQTRKKLLAEIGKDAIPLGGEPRIEVNGMSEQNQSFFNDATDALMLRGGVINKAPTEGARSLAKYSVVNLAEQYLKIQGISTGGMGAQNILAKAFEIKAAHTTSDFPNLLENVAHKSMRMAYIEEPASHVIWTGETEVQDFKPNSLVQLSEAPNLDELPEGAEYKHGTFGDESEKFAISTYGKMFRITRQALINDDLQAFTRLPQAFGQSSRRKECDLVYAVLTGNPVLADGTNLFHADHSNVVTGASTFDLAALASGRLKMRLQKGPAGLQPLNLIPRFLIVPAALETTAEQLIASIVDPSKSNDTPNAEFVRNLTLVVDSRLDAASATKFYLAASPGQVDTITRAYLAGEGRPFMETKMGWESDGMEIKCRLDFAAVPVDHRGLVSVAL